jgi:hypothetical protein
MEKGKKVLADLPEGRYTALNLVKDSTNYPHPLQALTSLLACAGQIHVWA